MAVAFVLAPGIIFASGEIEDVDLDELPYALGVLASKADTSSATLETLGQFATELQNQLTITTSMLLVEEDIFQQIDRHWSRAWNDNRDDDYREDEDDYRDEEIDAFVLVYNRSIPSYTLLDADFAQWLLSERIRPLEQLLVKSDDDPIAWIGFLISPNIFSNCGICRKSFSRAYRIFSINAPIGFRLALNNLEVFLEL